MDVASQPESRFDNEIDSLGEDSEPDALYIPKLGAYLFWQLIV